MTGFEHGRMGGHPLPNDAPPFTTLVHLTWEEGRIEHRIRFGRSIYQRTVDRRSRVVGFAPNSVFAFVRPGGDLLLKLHGWPKVERVLHLIDAIEARGIDPSDVAPTYWRHVHNRLTANTEPRPYLYTRPARCLARPQEHPAMSPRRFTLVAMRAGAALTVVPIVTGHAPRFIWNASRSVAVGLYSLAPVGTIEVAISSW